MPTSTQSQLQIGINVEPRTNIVCGRHTHTHKDISRAERGRLIDFLPYVCVLGDRAVKRFKGRARVRLLRESAEFSLSSSCVYVCVSFALGVNCCGGSRAYSVYIGEALVGSLSPSVSAPGRDNPAPRMRSPPPPS